MRSAFKRYGKISVICFCIVLACSLLVGSFALWLYAITAQTVSADAGWRVPFILLMILGATICSLISVVFYVSFGMRILQRSQKDAFLLFEQAPDGIFLLDEFGIIRSCNERVESLLHTERATVVGQHISTVYQGDESLWGPQSIDERQDYVEAELTFINAQGGMIPVWYKGTMLYDEREAFSGVILHVRDISARKMDEEERLRLEKDLNQARKMESVGTLAAGIAHEINTPIQFIGDNVHFFKRIFDRLIQCIDAYKQGIADIIGGSAVVEVQDRMDDLEADVGYEFCKEEMPRAFHEIDEGLERVANIVSAMKAFAHKGIDEKVAADINQAIGTTITLSRNAWKEVADITTDLDAELPMVTCCVAEINQVIMNLILNAADAIKEAIDLGKRKRGEILLTTRGHTDHIVISVADNGIGIPEDVRAKVFDQFFTTKDVGKGTGQGLALVYKTIVDNHRGNVSFDTEVNEGTTFRITLPIA